MNGWLISSSEGVLAEPDMNFLFASIQTFESDFDGRVGAELTRLGHEVDHVTVSRRSARRLREQGYRASCLPDLIADLPPHDVEEEVPGIEEQYRLGTIRDVYRTDPPSESRSEEWCVS